MGMLDTETEISQSSLISRNITVLGRRTSVRLEPEMWSSIREIAKREKCKIHDLCSLVYIRKNAETSLTAAIRVFIMLYYRAAATEDGHMRAGHGRFDNMLRRARLSVDESLDQASRKSFASLSEKHLKKLENEEGNKESNKESNRHDVPAVISNHQASRENAQRRVSHFSIYAASKG